MIELGGNEHGKNILRTCALTAALVLGLTACGTQEPVTVRVGLTGAIYEEIWNPIAEELKDEGINIELVQFSDFSLPNAALDSGDIEMNAFQHHAYFNNEVETQGYDISAVGDTIAIPGDASNGGRALKLLESAGIIKLKDDAGTNPEISDIETYNVKVEFVEADASNIYSMLPDVTAAVINGNYALDCGLDPQEDGIFFEKDYDDDSYFCLIAVRSEDKDNPVCKRIVEAFQSDSTKQIFQDVFKGFFVPAWE